MDKIKRAEFIVTAESTRGIERAMAFALKHIDDNNFFGEHTIEKLNAHVKWSVVEVAVPTEFETILDAPQEPAPPPEPVFPDISMMDIEDAKGVVGTAGTLADLSILEGIECGGTRTPGGRRGVLNYIDKRRTELRKAEAEALKKAEAVLVHGEDRE
jgi:hypothetical protein